MPEDSHCVTISQMPVAMVNVFRVTFELGHGDTEARPNPAPSASRISVTAAAVNAPPMIAPHATAEVRASLRGSTSRMAAAVGAIGVSGIVLLRSVPEQGEDDDDRNGNAKQPKQKCP